MKRLIILFLIISGLLLSCGLDNISRDNNWGWDQKRAISEKKYGEFIVSKLFTTDEGVTVYRFVDASHTRYFAINEKTKDLVSVLSTTTKKSGKTTIEEDDQMIIPK
jgi:hypothetical protein